MFLLFSCSVQLVVSDMLVTFKQSLLSDPRKTSSNPFQLIGPLSQLRGNFAILLAIEVTFFYAFSTIFFLSTISTILVSSISLSSKNLSLQNLFSTILKTWTRPLITTFYVSCLSIGYFISVITLLAPLLMSLNIATHLVAFLVGTTACVFYIYLSVPWILAVVVSVVEERSYGLEALGKGSALVKDKRVQGFLLNIFFNLLFFILFRCYRMISGKHLSPTLSLMLLTSVASLVKILNIVVYTVYYFQCKELHGEEFELPGSVLYSQLPVTQLANEMP